MTEVAVEVDNYRGGLAVGRGAVRYFASFWDCRSSAGPAVKQGLGMDKEWNEEKVLLDARGSVGKSVVCIMTGERNAGISLRHEMA